MVKLVSAFLVMILAAASMGQARYKAVLGGKNIGSARLSQRLTAEGGKQIELVIELVLGPEQVTVRSQSWFDAKGFPTRKVLDVGPKGKAATRTVIATFDSKGATLVVRENGTPKPPLRVGVATGARWDDPGEFWIFRDKPKPGTKVDNLQLSLDTLSWDRAETTYVGKTKDGHRVVLRRGNRTITTFLDEAGLPNRIEDSNGLVLTREP